jgi:hypothetical protein
MCPEMPEQFEMPNKPFRSRIPFRIKTNIAILRTDIIYAKDGHLATFDQVEGAHAVAVQPFPQSFKVLVPWRQVTALPVCIEISMA